MDRYRGISAKLVNRIFELIGKPIFLFILIFFTLLTHLTIISKRYFKKINQFKHLNLKPLPSRLLSILKSHNSKNPHRISPPSHHLKLFLKFLYFSYLRHRSTFSPQLPKLSLPSITLPPLRFHLPRFRFRLPRPHLHLSLPFTLPKVKVHYFKLLFLILFISSGFYTYQVIFKDLPHPRDLLNHKPAITTNIYDRHHHLLYQIYKDENRHPVDLTSIPPQVIQATLAIEDSEFYDHPGFSLRGIIRALRINATENKLQGGSTITQQLVKNTLLSQERTLTRKVKELFLALAVESYFTKDEILSMYLNKVGFGGTAYGIEAAAQYYFNSTVSELNLAEAALLAGLPASPTTFSPFGNYPELALDRQKLVLRRMRQEGFITAAEEKAAAEFPLTFANPATNIEAPHFVMYVKELLVKEFGEEIVSQGGLEVVTTLDRDIQELVEITVREELDNLRKLNVSNAAVMVTKPDTGEILSMLGSANYFDSQQDGQVNVALRPRQPGSSIKPLTYAYALEHGFTPSTIIVDAPITYHIPGSEPYSPQNYDGRYHGRVTLRQALANSYNIPAVKTLEKIGVSNLVNFAASMGITTWNDPSQFGLALTLGSGEVTLADMSVVYGTFANQGYKVPLNPLLRVSDFQKQLIDHQPCGQNAPIAFAKPAQAQSTECLSHQVIKPSTAYLLSDILSDNQARASAFGTHSVLHIPGHQVAVKTGTTNSLRDNWTIGYTKDYVVGVWVGNNDNTPMSHIASGITGASSIWNKIMTALLKEEPPHQFTPDSADLVKVSVCPLTGTLTCQACPHPREEYFIPGTEPRYGCTPEMIRSTQESPARDRILTGASTH